MRVFNFSAGPAVLPLEVLEQVKAELTDWSGSGMSVMEVSHRSKAFIAVAAQAEADLREILRVPTNYKVLFLQGGASAQFAGVPLNLSAPDATADYVVTGNWSKKAVSEAKKYLRVNVAADSAPVNNARVPVQSELKLTAGAAYVHYTPNETIGGLEFPYVPETGDVPLVADFSSTILSRPIDVSRFGVIYAGAQKNIGPAGLCIVLVRDDLLERARPIVPGVLSYKEMAATDSMSNTPPTFAWYVAGLVFQWIKRLGGLEAVAARNRAKSQKLYDAIDASPFYGNPIDTACRSWMNVPFTIAKPELEKTFVAEANHAGLTHLEGHRSVGGMRASLYNALPPEGVDALIGFMKEFERRHG
ncbi:MAG: 3-phosphoserine/phosphohydroxythreonine transaminase [Steroidobacteraceae bacterium]